MSITSGIGLISGIDTFSLIEQLLAVDAQAKVPSLQRIAGLNASKTALLDVNARLLSLGNSARAFRQDDIFRSVLATSSNAEVLGVSATTNAIPGQYTFRVKQMVSTSQVMSAGLVSSSQTPLGLDQLSFEWGQGRLDDDMSLERLNGGMGVERGSIRIEDASGAVAIIDLSTATTIEEVMDAVNGRTDVRVEMTLTGDGLRINDLSGGSGSISVLNEGGSSTAADLGFNSSSASGFLNGDDINTLGPSTLLSQLNDDNGVLIRDNVADFQISLDGGSAIGIDLGRQDTPITGETLLEDLNNGDGVTINDDSERPDFTIVASNGVEVDIDLGAILDEDGEIDEPAVDTVTRLLARVNNALEDEFGPGQVNLAINAEGTGFTLTDAIGGGDEPEILGAGPNGDETAEDLGILGTGVGGVIAGGTVPNKIETPRAATIQDVIDRIHDQTGGLVTASIGPDGSGLQLAAGGSSIQVTAGTLDGQTLIDLGFEVDGVGTTLSGDRVLSGFGTVLVDTINGGRGLEGTTSITVSDRSGNTTTLSDLDQYDTVRDLIKGVNIDLVAAGVDVRLQVNEERNGLAAVDTSGGSGNLTISGAAASVLGLEVDVASDTARGENVQRQYVSLASGLEDLNYGRGIGRGKFRITDGSGNSSVVDIGSDSVTLQDIIAEINSRPVDVTARLNDNGDGLVIEDTGADSQTPIKIESVSGSTARDLGILGESDSVGGSIDGSYEKIVDLDPTDTLEDVVGSINDAGIAVTASVLNTGSSGTPYRLVMSSEISGLAGDLVVDSGGVDLGLSTLTQARNAKVFVGEGDSPVLVESASNTVEDVVAGITLELASTSEEVVTVNVTRDRVGILEAVERFVTSFNDVVDRMNAYDTYDAETETRGPLLGDPTLSRLGGELYRTLQRSALGIDTQYRYLSEVGIRIGKEGRIDFNQEKFDAAFEQDPDAVANLFTAFEQQGSSTETISEGITIDRTNTTYTAQGFGDIFKDLVDRMTNSIDGTVTLADRQFQTLIDSQNDRIARVDERIEAKRLRLQREFAAMEASLARLQSQQSSLGAINQNLAAAGALLG